MEDFLDLYLARIIKIILLFLNVQDLNHTDYFQSEQDDLISNKQEYKMSPKQKTATKRHASSRPNKRNMRKRLLQIQENAILLQSLAQE